VSVRAGRVPVLAMPLMSSIARFARSPQGQRLARQAMRMAQDPKNREKIAQVRKDLAVRRGGGPPR